MLCLSRKATVCALDNFGENFDTDIISWKETLKPVDIPLNIQVLSASIIIILIVFLETC